MSENENHLFKQLALECMDNLYSKAIRMVNNTKIAEDLVQQTYELAYNRFEQFDKSDDFEKWLIGIFIFIWASNSFREPMVSNG